MYNREAKGHLVTAYRLLEDVSPEIQSFMEMKAQGKSAAGAASAVEKTLQLAEAEVDTAEQIEPTTEIVMNNRVFDIRGVRSVLYSNRGILEYVSGSLSDGRRYLERAAEQQDTAFVQFWLGLIAADAGNKEQALQHLNRCLALDPGGELSEPTRRHIAELKGTTSKSGCAALLLLPVVLAAVVAAASYL